MLFLRAGRADDSSPPRPARLERPAPDDEDPAASEAAKWALTCRCRATCEGKRAPQCGRMHLKGLCPPWATTWRSSQDMEQEALPATLQLAHSHTKRSPSFWLSTWVRRRCSSRSAGLTTLPHAFHWHATSVSSVGAGVGVGVEAKEPGWEWEWEEEEGK